MNDTIKRVLVLTPAIDGADGISALSRQVVTSLARALGPSQVEVWALDGGLVYELAGVDFWSAGGSRLGIVRRAMTRAARRADDLHIVVLHMHLAPLAGLVGRRGASTTLFLIGIEVWTALRARERRAVERADRLVAISQFTARGFRQANPAFADRAITICAPGIDAAPRPAAAAVDIDDGFALIVGRLSSAERYKGHEALVDAWPAVRASAAGARLLVVGDGDDRGRLESLVASRGLGDAIAFLGRVDDVVLAALYARASFFVMPSPREGFGLVYLEAMRAGKPCIAVHGSADEIIRHGVDGLVIDAGSTEALAGAIIRLFSDGAARARMGAAARQRVHESFTEAHFTRRLLDTLELSPVPEPAAVPAMR